MYTPGMIDINEWSHLGVNFMVLRRRIIRLVDLELACCWIMLKVS